MTRINPARLPALPESRYRFLARRERAMDAIEVEKFAARVEGLFLANRGGFETRPLDRLDLTFEGIAGDIHAGLTRTSGARELWYPRGTEIRNERQVSIVSVEELARIARGLSIDRLAAEWIGSNILLSGVPGLSSLPPRTQIFFDSGATVRIDGDNGPCRTAGRSVASHVPSREALEFEFVKVAQGLRGLVGWVERPGPIAVGEAVTVRVWRQPAWRGAPAGAVNPG
ncbi:MAG: MOSC domain-containing protein [Cucumibacter sp.]